MDKFNQSLVRPEIPIKEISRESPEFILPAVAAAILISLGMGLVMFLSVLFFAIGIQWKPEWRPAMAISGFVMGVIGIYWAFQGAEGIMWRVEKIIGADAINHDGYIGEPPRKPQYLVVEAQQNPGGNSFVMGKLPLPEDNRILAAWIDAGLHQRSLAIDRWERPFGYIYPNGIKTSIYSLFKMEAESREWITDRGTHGIMLSDEGRRVFRKELEQLSVLALPEGEEE